MKPELKKLAIKLRKKGKTYREILKQIPISKGTLSLWLRDIELPADYFEKIKDITQRKIEKAAAIWREKSRIRHEKVYNEYNPPYNEPFFMLGLGIYMGEGEKYSRYYTGVSNSNIKFLLIYKKWTERFFAESSFRWKGHLSTHDNIDENKARKWWEDNLNISTDFFSKSVITISKASKRKRNTLKRGTFHLKAGGKGAWKIAEKIKKAIDYAPVV